MLREEIRPENLRLLSPEELRAVSNLAKKISLFVPPYIFLNKINNRVIRVAQHNDSKTFKQKSGRYNDCVVSERGLIRRVDLLDNELFCELPKSLNWTTVCYLIIKS